MLAGSCLQKWIANAFARIPLGVEHPHDQRHQPAIAAPSAYRAQKPEPPPVMVNVDLLRLAADLFQLFGCLVHVALLARCYNHAACRAKSGRSSRKVVAKAKVITKANRRPRRGPWPPDPARVRSVIDGLEELYPDVDCELDRETPFQLVIATILSAQTTDDRVNMVTPELFRRYPTPETMAKAPLPCWRRSSVRPASSA
jgi:hypothetical protein